MVVLRQAADASNTRYVTGLRLAFKDAQRSAYGPDNPWYIRAKKSATGRIRADGVERDVTFAEVPADTHAAIDAAYHTKYDRYGPRIVGSVTGPTAEAVTIRLVAER